MMQTALSPTLHNRKLAAQLRCLRTERGLTQEQVAKRLDWSPTKMSCMDTGHNIGTPRDIRDLCGRQRLIQLAQESEQQGWWQGYHLDYFATSIGMEVEAVAIKYYQSSIVPGLLQTPDYARVMYVVSTPKIAPVMIDQRIEVRLRRQQRHVQDPPVRLEVVLDEAVLHRLVGDQSIMRGQLDRLIELSKQPNVTMQVIPFDASAHPAMDRTFSILESTSSHPVRCMLRGREE